MVTPVVVGAIDLVVGQYEVALVPYLLILITGLILFVPVALFRKWYFYRRYHNLILA